MLSQQKQCVKRKWLSRASWLALLSLAYMQLGIAGHQFEHSADHLDSCDVCVKADRLDDVVAGSPVSLDIPRPADRIETAKFDVAVDGSATTGFSPRGPPSL